MRMRLKENVRARRSSKAKIRKSAQKVGVVFLVMFFVLSIAKIRGTNSFFTDTANVSGNTMTAGYWIPTLTHTVDKADPDGENGWYVTEPCIKLFSDIDDVTMHYSFAGDHEESGTADEDTCIYVPEGVNDFSATATNNENSSWASSPVGQDFKVDTQCPFAEITDPDSGDNLNGTVEIRGTVTDVNPDHYWLVIEYSGGHQIAGPKTVSDTDSFTDEKFFDWDTTGVADGDYTIKLEARDAAGNKCPDQAPVASDPENTIDSVDWISVTVENSSPENKIVLNEILPNPEGDDSATKPGGEWVELYNLSETETYDLSDFSLEDASGNSIDVEPCRTNTGETTIGPEDFLVVYRKGGDSCTSHDFSLNDSGDTVKLLNDAGVIIDEYKYETASSTDADSDENNSAGAPNNSASGSEITAQEGKSHARIPDGTGDWVDPIPTPGKPNKLEDGGESDEQDENADPTETQSTQAEPENSTEEPGESSNNEADEKEVIDEEAKEEENDTDDGTAQEEGDGEGKENDEDEENEEAGGDDSKDNEIKSEEDESKNDEGDKKGEENEEIKKEDVAVLKPADKLEDDEENKDKDDEGDGGTNPDNESTEGE